MEFEGEEISSKRIRKLWKEFKPSKPIPKIKGYNVSKEELFKIMSCMDEQLKREGKNPESGMLREYGNVEKERTTAIVTYVESTGVYIIFRMLESPYSKKNDLRHELRHIYNGEV